MPLIRHGKAVPPSPLGGKAYARGSENAVTHPPTPPPMEGARAAPPWRGQGPTPEGVKAYRHARSAWRDCVIQSEAKNPEEESTDFVLRDPSGIALRMTQKAWRRENPHPYPAPLKRGQAGKRETAPPPLYLRGEGREGGVCIFPPLILRERSERKKRENFHILTKLDRIVSENKFFGRKCVKILENRFFL